MTTANPFDATPILEGIRRAARAGDDVAAHFVAGGALKGRK